MRRFRTSGEESLNLGASSATRTLARGGFRSVVFGSTWSVGADQVFSFMQSSVSPFSALPHSGTFIFRTRGPLSDAPLEEKFLIISMTYAKIDVSYFFRKPDWGYHILRSGSAINTLSSRKVIPRYEHSFRFPSCREHWRCCMSQCSNPTRRCGKQGTPQFSIPQGLPIRARQAALSF